MSEPKRAPKDRRARETQGEGVPQRKRKEGSVSSEAAAEPQRGNEPADPHLIERRRDARNPEGI